MTLRTPRRRISPRTKRRYRAIREFFRRAIGSSSQPDIKINSSIALNVTDLKRQIIGLEEQLDQVSKHCQDVVQLQTQSSKTSESLVCQLDSDQIRTDHVVGTIKEQTEVSTDRKSDGIETRLLYKFSDCNYRKSDESDSEQRHNKIHNVEASGKMNDEYNRHTTLNNKERKHKLGNINKHHSKLHKHKTHSAYENFSANYSTSSFHSLANPRNAHSHANYADRNDERKHYKQQYRSISPNQLKDKKHKEYMKRKNMDNYCTIYENQPVKARKQRQVNRRELDQDFIADIIRRQYRPMKMFGKRESDITQFSVPVCRDQEFSIHENIQEDPELCSCCYNDKRIKHRHNDLEDMRSICDTRLYSSKRHQRPQRRVPDVYNNSELYDLVPVKEKTSPKSRRKFVQDNLMPYGYYKEVPPSPRTLRPRLNLKSQYYTEFDDYMVHSKSKCPPNRPRRHHEYVETVESDITADLIKKRNERNARRARRADKEAQMQDQQEQMQDMDTMSSVQYSRYDNQQRHMVDTSRNKTQDTDVSIDKTDKALCEIKDILQSFLQEIKKETTSQCDKSDNASKTGENDISILQQNSDKGQGSAIPNSGQRFNNYTVGQCQIPPYMQSSFTNPCCYPIMCPMNCMQGGFVMPTPSFTCANCAVSPKETSHDETQCSKPKTLTNEIFNSETEEMIKEIHKFVAHGAIRKTDSVGKKKAGDMKLLTSRSVGGSIKQPSKHDAQVGTPKLKYSSKSCEAIGSNVVSDAYYSTNQSYSDTVLEGLSLEVTHSDTDVSTEFTEVEKHKENKISKVLRSFGFLKKKKDVIEELSESESTIDVEIKPKPKPQPPFKQEMMNYMMYGQNYYNPPFPMQRQSFQQPPEYHPDYHQPYNTRVPEYHQQIQDLHMMKQQQPVPDNRVPYRAQQQPTAPPYSPLDNRYNPHHHQSQVPLCLKEIEVKSIATQSERKMSIFRKFKKKIQPPTSFSYDPQRNFGTQTAQDNRPNWIKNLQAKAMQENTNPMNFSMNTQKQLAEGDMKIRNAMIKKLFHKRNPFSPRNLIVKTLLGKDKSSYGEPPMQFRPRMFF